MIEFTDDSPAKQGFCLWYTVANSGDAPDYATAEQQIRADLLR